MEALYHTCNSKTNPYIIRICYGCNYGRFEIVSTNVVTIPNLNLFNTFSRLSISLIIGINLNIFSLGSKSNVILSGISFIV